MGRWIGIAFGAALVAAFLPPLLSGSSHTCPVLRQQDSERGPAAQAVPAFARKYKVECTYCHTAWPQLNRTGYIFRRLGYRMPWEVPHEGAGAPTTNLPPGVTSGLQKAAAGATAPGAAAGSKPATPEKIAEGAKLFNQMQCFTCHVNGGNVINPKKPIKGQDFLNKYPEDEQIAKIVRNGVPGTAMPAYGPDRLSDEQLSSIIAYIRSLTPTQH